MVKTAFEDRVVLGDPLPRSLLVSELMSLSKREMPDGIFLKAIQI